MKLNKILLIILAVMSAFKASLRKRTGPSSLSKPFMPKKALGDSPLEEGRSHGKIGPNLPSSHYQHFKKLPDTDPLSKLKNVNYMVAKDMGLHPKPNADKMQQSIDEKTNMLQDAINSYARSESHHDLKKVKQLGYSLADEIQVQVDSEPNSKAKIPRLEKKLKILNLIMNPTFSESAPQYAVTAEIPSEIISPTIGNKNEKACTPLWLHLKEMAKTDIHFLFTFLKEGGRNEDNRDINVIRCLLNLIYFYNELSQRPDIRPISLSEGWKSKIIHRFVHFATQTASDITARQETQHGRKHSDLINLLTSQAFIEFDYYLTELELKLRKANH